MPALRVPERVGDLGLYLREQREQAKLSLRELAKVAGVSNPYLSQIERGLRKPSAEVLQQIAKGLQISAEALYLRAGILDDSRGLAVEVAIQTDTTLTQRQRRVMLDIYASFQAENARVAEVVTPVPAPEAAPAEASNGRPSASPARRTPSRTPSSTPSTPSRTPSTPSRTPSTPSRTAAGKRASKRSSTTAPTAPQTTEGPDNTAQPR